MDRRAFCLSLLAVAGCSGGDSSDEPSAPLSALIYTPQDPAFSYTDGCAITITPLDASFLRPIADGQGFEHCNPGARIRFLTDSADVVVHLQYTNLVTNPVSSYNSIGAVLVNGKIFATFSRAQGPVGPVDVPLAFGSSGQRTVEVVLPYLATVDFVGVSLDVGASLMPAASRPATRYVALGDSITMGLAASGIATTWAFLLAQAKGYELVNMGYGGRLCVATDGATAAALNPALATYLIGFNDLTAQTPLATFKASYLSVIQGFRAGAPGAKLYCITPLFSQYAFSYGANTLEMYRQQIRDAVAQADDPLTTFIEGEPLAPNNSAAFPGDPHPGDGGEAAIAAALAPLLVVA